MAYDNLAIQFHIYCPRVSYEILVKFHILYEIS